MNAFYFVLVIQLHWGSLEGRWRDRRTGTGSASSDECDRWACACPGTGSLLSGAQSRGYASGLTESPDSSAKERSPLLTAYMY